MTIYLSVGHLPLNKSFSNRKQTVLNYNLLCNPFKISDRNKVEYLVRNFR